jgi:hypothetical protein
MISKTCLFVAGVASGAHLAGDLLSNESRGGLYALRDGPLMARFFGARAGKAP